NEILRTASQLDPKNIDTKLWLAQVLTRAKALEEALDVVNAAGDLNSHHAGVLAARATILLRLNDATGALREAQAALEIGAANVEALGVLAADKMKRGDAHGALAILNRASAIQPDNFDIELVKLGVYERLGDLTQVESQLRKFVELHPKEPAFRKALVKLYV